MPADAWNGIAAAETVLIYVDPTNGNDANPGTLALPVRTGDAAFALMPAAWRKLCHIVAINDGITPATVIVNSGEVFVGSAVGEAAAPLVIISDPIVLYNATETSGGSDNVITDTSLNLADDEVRGRSIYCITGANAGTGRKIASNTLHTVTPVLDWDNTVDAGDTFTITQCGAYLNSPSDSLAFQDSSLALVNVGISGGSVMQTVNLALLGSEIDGLGGANFFNNCIINADSVNLFAWFNDPDFVDDLGNGCYVHDSFLVVQEAATVSGFFVFDNTFLDARFEATLRLFGVNALATDFLVEFASNARFFSSSSVIGVISGGSVTVDENSVCHTGNTIIKSSESDAITVNRRSFVNVAGTTGTGNSGYGVVLSGMSQCQFSSTTSVTGGSGDALVGADVFPAGSWAGALRPNGWSELYTQGMDKAPTLNRIDYSGV